MTKQDLQLHLFNWRLTVYYNLGPYVPDEVILNLWEHKCPNQDIKTIILTLQKRNSGFTYTNSREHFSIIGIGKATTRSEFINTVVHEIKHLQSDICNQYDISHTGEEASIIVGEIAKAMYYGFLPYIT